MLNKKEIERLKDFFNLHEGGDCWIIGNGPSINQTNLLMLKGSFTFAVNAFITHKNFEQLLPTYYVATNPRLMCSDFLKDDLISKLRENDITCFLNYEAKPIIGYPYENLYYIETTESPLIVDAGYNLDITKRLLGTRVSVVIQAVIPIAVYMGFKQIFLVGCDNDYKDLSMEKTHFYGTAECYPNLLKLDNTARELYPSYFRKKEITALQNSLDGNEEFSIVYREVKKLGVKIYNCTIGGKLEVFPRLRFEDVVKKNTLNRITLQSSPLSKINKCNVEQLLPTHHSIPISNIEINFEYGEMPAHEQEILCKLIKSQNPKTIFEIGTFQGATTTRLAANSNAVVYTLDLPPKGHIDYHPPGMNDPELDVYPDQLGIKHFTSAYADRIIQLYGDTRSFDYSPYYEQMDIVFVDACHHYDFVLRDSMHAFKMIKPDGMIIWHDYADYAPGVMKALNVISERYSLTHIEGTSLVVYSGKWGEIDNKSEINTLISAYSETELFNMVQKMIDEKNFALARTTVSKSLEMFPASVNLLYAKAKINIETGHINDAQITLLKIIEISPENLNALNGLASIEINKGNIETAIEFLRDILILDPNNQAVLTLISNIKTKLLGTKKTYPLHNFHNIPKELRQSYYDHTKDPLSNIDYYRALKDRLVSLNVIVEEREIDINDFEQWLNEFSEIKNHYQNHGDVFIEKCLEHYVTYRYLNISQDDVFIDIAASGSPWAEVLNFRGIKSYRLDMTYPGGFNGINIGADASNSGLPDGFCSALALHCAFECFMGNADISFAKEASRILKTNGRYAIAPLYLEDTFFVSTSPFCDQKNITIEKEALKVWRDDEYKVPFDRFYSPESFKQRIHSHIPENMNAKVIYFNNLENLNKYYKGQRIYCFFMFYGKKKW